MQEKANPADNANAYLRGLTNYCTKRCCFEAKLPYEHSALSVGSFPLFKYYLVCNIFGNIQMQKVVFNRQGADKFVAVFAYSVNIGS